MFRIAVYQEGKHMGWVQTVSIFKNKFSLTEDKSKAKHGYKNLDEIQGDIDICSAMGRGKYTFTVDETE